METLTGLSSKEAAERKKRGLSNHFEARVGRGYWDIFRDNIFNLFNVVLFTLLLIVLLLRDYPTVFFAGFSVVTNAFLGMIQEINAKRKLDRMASLAAKTAHVIRDGQRREISIKDIVIDDIIIIEPGDRMAVDGTTVTSDALELDESQLTGESDAVYKQANDPIYSGSFCNAGSGLMLATKVGKDSTINQLSVIAKAYKNVLTPTQKKIAAIVEISVLIMLITAPMLWVSSSLQGETTLGLVRNLVVFTTSMVPQGLVLVAILALTIGAVRISMHQTLIQRVNAVESLANVTVLCFDKTGTLTQNKLSVRDIMPLNGQSLDSIRGQLDAYVRHLSYQNSTASAIAASVNGALAIAHNSVNVGGGNGAVLARADEYTHKLREIPFTSARKWGAITFPSGSLVLGAPERILPPNSPVQVTATALASQGMRLLAFAHTDELLETGATNGATIHHHCTPIALIVMSDQIRDDIRTTLDDFRQLNVNLKVISGDNLETVRAIAGQSGMSTSVAYTGDQLKAMNEDEFEAAILRADAFARIEPDTKRRIIQGLQKQGEYVAMVGDGVNDVPALKAANLAIVMNDGTQISKDVADIVLLNNAMSTLPLAFREGREITQTIYGTTKMFLAKNVYNFLLFIFIGFMMLPFPITPVQISVAAFGTVNMPAGLIAIGLLRPKFVRNFRADVIDYLLITGIIGASIMALLFGVVYFATGGDLIVSRSVLSIFICLFGMMIVWNVQGVEVHDLRSFLRYWRVVLVSGLATVLTILVFYATPAFFEFRPPPQNTTVGIGINILIAALFCLTLMLVNQAIRHPYLLNRLWMLVDQEK